MVKPKPIGNMKPRKKKALDPSEVEKVARGKTWRLNIGTPNEPAEEDLRFLTQEAMKKGAIKALRDWTPWLKRYNNSGIAALEAAIAEVDALTTFGREPKIVDCDLDPEMTKVKIRLILRHD